METVPSRSLAVAEGSRVAVGGGCDGCTLSELSPNREDHLGPLNDYLNFCWVLSLLIFRVNANFPEKPKLLTLNSTSRKKWTFVQSKLSICLRKRRKNCLIQELLLEIYGGKVQLIKNMHSLWKLWCEQAKPTEDCSFNELNFVHDLRKRLKNMYWLIRKNNKNIKD